MRVSSQAVQYYLHVIKSLSYRYEGSDSNHSIEGLTSVNNPSGEEELNRIGFQYLSEALCELSDVLEFNSIQQRNISIANEAFSYLLRSAALGNAPAQHRLAAVYSSGIFGASLVPVDASRALALEYLSGMNYTTLVGFTLLYKTYAHTSTN